MYGEERQQQDLIVPVWYRRLMRQQGFLFHVFPGIRERQELKYLLRRRFREILYIMDGMWESILEMVR